MRDHTDLMQQKAEVGSIDTKTIEFCKSDSCNAGSLEVFVVAICSVFRFGCYLLCTQIKSAPTLVIVFEL
jgi:hypothetical protein